MPEHKLKRTFSAKRTLLAALCVISCFFHLSSLSAKDSPRERLSLNDGWKFMKYADAEDADDLIYDVRPEFEDDEDGKAADAKPTEAVEVKADRLVLKPWILPTANDFIADPAQRHERPEGNPGADFPFVQGDFDDSDWEQVTLPHDWAIEGPFMEGWDTPVGGGMGRLPSPGVAWYRRGLEIPAEDQGKSIFLDIDGAMSYAMVWCNGQLVGGWPYGYASWQVELTPYLNFGGANQIAIRIDNPPASARWYPGGGLYRNVWLSKTDPVHVANWGVYVTTPVVSEDFATVQLEVSIENDSAKDVAVVATTELFELDLAGAIASDSIARYRSPVALVAKAERAKVGGSILVENPKLWGPYPNQVPNQYLAVTTLESDGTVLDRYETRFGIRELRFDAEQGFFVNGERLYFQGANQHHDLGALGAAFNVRAAERQLEILREMGCNAIRMAHNPPAPELLELTDKMGFVVVNEIYDVWERKKTPLDFHLIFPEWSEPDLRAFMRRDRNSPSNIMWSVGNEVGEQYTGEAGTQVARRLQRIAKEEDATRPTAASFNYAKPDMSITGVMDSITLNYQGEGIRDAPAYSHLQGIRTTPLYPRFHDAYPGKMIISSENAAAVSSRGEYLFPVSEGMSAPVADGAGGDPESAQVSSYELYTAPFGSSADKVFRSLEQHPYVAGGFVWSGWDYLGEPTPYYSARSSYFGVIDLAGFKKDRFYLYQSVWRPDFPMVHVLPHWNWKGREGEITPVHVFTTGDSAELFVNGKSQGLKEKKPFEYRIRWDEVVYQPGSIEVVAYREGEEWARQKIETTGKASKLSVEADRSEISADGQDLSFVTVRLLDKKGRFVANAKNELSFSIEGPAEIVATDNGDPTSMVEFPSLERPAFNGLCLAIVRGLPGQTGTAKVTVTGPGLKSASVEIELQ